MRRNDAQLGKPQVLYKDTKANIEALTGLAEGSIAYATDTNEPGTFNGSTWDWGGGGSFDLADAIHSATSDSTFHDDDEFAKSDSQDSWGLKNFTWANIKTALTTYFDTLYAALTHSHAASDITSGTIATARLGSGTVNAATFLRGDQTYAPTNSIFKIKNTSGATANSGDVGYINEAGEYKTTTTAQAVLSWFVVLVGGANNADIYVTKSGRVTVNYTGTAPSAGHYLVTSTVAGLAQRETAMHYAIFAVCLAAGSGGTVDVLLLCNTVEVSARSSSAVMQITNTNGSDFSALINAGGSGGLTATNVPFDNITGSAGCIVIESSFGALRLYNSTRGTYRLVTAANATSNFVTTVSSVDSWADNDSITMESQTVLAGGVPRAFEVDLSQSSLVPIMARKLIINTSKRDTATLTNYVTLHPIEAYDSKKQDVIYTVALNTFISKRQDVPLINRRFATRFSAGGTNTQSFQLLLAGYSLAVP